MTNTVTGNGRDSVIRDSAEIVLSIDPKAHERLLKVLDQGARLPPMPALGAELLRLLHQPPDSIMIGRVADLVDRDQVLAARLLKIANSPCYSTVCEVTRVKQAIVTIGLDETISALNFLLIRNLMPKIPALPHFQPEEFWRHSLGCACIARLLGNPQFLLPWLPGELYLAGLLHDIGKVVLATHLPEEFARCLEFSNKYSLPLEQIEGSAIGVNHAVLGAHLLNDWNIPPRILDAVAFHHAPDEASEQYRQMAALIELADLLAGELKIGSGGNPSHKPLAEAAMHSDQASSLATQEVWERMLQEVSVAALQQVSMMDARNQSPDASAQPQSRPYRPTFRPPPPQKKSFLQRIAAIFHA